MPWRWRPLKTRTPKPRFPPSLQGPRDVRRLGVPAREPAAPPRARAAGGAAGLLSRLRQRGVGARGRRGAHSAPPERAGLLSCGSARDAGKGARLVPARQVFAHLGPDRGRGRDALGLGAKQVLTAPPSTRGPGRAEGREPRGPGALRMKDAVAGPAGGVREWARPSRRELSASARRTHHTQPPGPGSPGLARLCAPVGWGLGSQEGDPRGRSVMGALPEGPEAGCSRPSQEALGAPTPGLTSPPSGTAPPLPVRPRPRSPHWRCSRVLPLGEEQGSQPPAG